MSTGDKLNGTGLSDLPDDVLFMILRQCSVESLGRLSATCRRFAKLVARDSVWKKHLESPTLLVVNSSTKDSSRLPLKEHFRLSRNWNKGDCHQLQVIRYNKKQIPWLQLEGDCLWASDRNMIRCYQMKRNGRLADLHRSFQATSHEVKQDRRYMSPGFQTIHHHYGDVQRFKLADKWLITGNGDGSVTYGKWTGNEDLGSGMVRETGGGGWSSVSHLPGWHRDVVHSVDIERSAEVGRMVAVSGSRDHTVRVWTLGEGEEVTEETEASVVNHSINVNERAWSVALQPGARKFVVGLSGLRDVPPLSLYETASGKFLHSLGENYRHGAGVLDVQFESEHVFYSCGYDTFVRLWDLRTPCANCVSQWEDPYDETVYCVKSDGHNAIVTGTARHGLVRLWDKRYARRSSVQLFYTGSSTSPVYSLAFNASHLYTVLDRGIFMRDFSKRQDARRS